MLGMMIGSFLTWLLVAAILNPSDGQFLATAYDRYFRELTYANLQQHSAYGDCKLTEPEKNDKAMGIAKFAMCSLTEPGGKNRTFTIALTPAASVFYTDNDAFYDDDG